MANNEALAKIEAAQAAETAATDKNLNQAYVNALKSNKNYNEVQNAYGLGSGNMAQQQLARALGTTETLTNLRNVLAENAAQRGQQRLATGEVYRDNIANAIAKNEQNRAAALYDAAEAEEQALIDAQQKAGATLAEQNDYSVLGKLYGLTQDQIDRLQGTGAYTPVESTSGSGGRGTGGDGEGEGTVTLSQALEGYYGAPSEIGKDTQMTEKEVAELYERLDAARALDAQIAEQSAYNQAIVQGNKAAAREQAKNPTSAKKTDDGVDAVSSAAPKASTTTVAQKGAANAVKSLTSALQQAAYAAQVEEEKALKQSIVQGNKAAARAKKK